MALFRCGGNSGLQETALWTNANSTTSFANQNVTLSESASDFDLIKIEWYSETSHTNLYSLYATPSDLLNGTITGDGKGYYGLGSNIGSSMRVRSAYLSNSTTMAFGACINAGSSSTTSNDHSIPYRVVGVKF